MIDELAEQNKARLMVINDLRYRNAQMFSKVNMNRVLKELERKVENANREKQMTALPQSPASPGAASAKGLMLSNTTLNDVLGEQLEFSCRYKTVVRCAYKWLYLTKKRLKQKKT